MMACESPHVATIHLFSYMTNVIAQVPTPFIFLFEDYNYLR
jgi:hypothetical protein